MCKTAQAGFLNLQDKNDERVVLVSLTEGENAEIDRVIRTAMLR